MRTGDLADILPTRARSYRVRKGVDMQSGARPRVVLAAVLGLPVVACAALVISLWLYSRFGEMSEPPPVAGTAASPPGPRHSSPPLGLIERARELVREGAASGPYRYGMLMRSAEAGKECTRRMTVLFAKHRALMDAARLDESADRSRVIGAYNDLFLCVGCSQQGDEACAKASVALR